MSDGALRIGYTCHDAFPSTHTNTQQIYWTLSEVARLGHRVELVVPALRLAPSETPEATLARHYGADSAHVPPTLRIVAAGDREPRTSLAKGRFDWTACARFSRETHDLIWTRDPLALVQAVRRGLPVVFETFRPDFAEARTFAAWRLVTLRARQCAGVITHSQLAADAFVRAGVPSSRVLVAHNGHAPSLMEPALGRAEARARAGLPGDRPLVVYAGHAGPQKGSHALLALAAALPEIRLALVGVDEGTAEHAWLTREAAAAGAGNVLLLPRVGVADVATYLYAADCLIVPPTDAPLRRYGRTVLPIKLFPYMAAGRPILAPALPDVSEVLADGVNAVLVKPDDLASAVDALRALLADHARAERLALAARDASLQFTWAARAARISDWLTDTVVTRRVAIGPCA